MLIIIKKIQQAPVKKFPNRSYWVKPGRKKGMLIIIKKFNKHR